MDSLERTIAEIRSKAAELRNSFGDEERARAIEWAASEALRGAGPTASGPPQDAAYHPGAEAAQHDAGPAVCQVAGTPR